MNKEEILRKSQLSSHLVSRCLIGDIGLVELEEREHCLGADLYDAMVADLVDYSAALPYTSGSYTAGDVVIYKGLYYEALVNTSSEPNNSAAWSLAKKFASDFYNDFYESVLGRYLALAVLRDSTPMVKTRVRDAGTVKLRGVRESPASRDEFEDLQNSILIKIYRAYNAMISYAAEHSGEGAIGTIKGLEVNCTCGSNLVGIDAMEAMFYTQVEWDYAATVKGCNNCRKRRFSNTNNYDVF